MMVEIKNLEKCRIKEIKINVQGILHESLWGRLISTSRFFEDF